MIRSIAGRDAADVEAVVSMLGRLRTELSLAVPFSPASARQLVRDLADSANGLVLVSGAAGSPQGMLIAAAQPYAFAPVLAAEEIAWWVEPEQRGHAGPAMLDAFEKWAIGIGATLIGVSDTGKSAAALYRRRGFRPAERKHFKGL